MSGHSKWHTIKHKKGAADAARGKVFSKLSKALTIAARDGGGKPESNVHLRLAMDKAREANMPAENINRAIKKGTGELGGAMIEEITYEGYGAGGVAVLVDVVTDNKNRAAADVRSTFTKNNGSLGGQGAVAWMFEQKGTIEVSGFGSSNRDDLELAAIDAGAQDIEADDKSMIVYTAPSDLESVKKALVDAGAKVAEAEVSMQPKSTVAVKDEKVAKQVLALIDALEALDDVQEVYANFDISDEIMQNIS